MFKIVISHLRVHGFNFITIFVFPFNMFLCSLANRLDKEFGGHSGLLLPDATQLPAEFDILFSNVQVRANKQTNKFRSYSDLKFLLVFFTNSTGFLMLLFGKSFKCYQRLNIFMQSKKATDAGVFCRFLGI